jgi:hypothetical protein
MKTLVLTTIAVAALGAAVGAKGAGVVCVYPYDPDRTPHENPALCAQFAGTQQEPQQEFNGPGQAAQYFSEMGAVGKNGRNLTPADIMRGVDRTGGACDTPAPGGR